MCRASGRCSRCCTKKWTLRPCCRSTRTLSCRLLHARQHRAQRQLDVQRDVFLFNTRLQTVEESGDIARLRRALAERAQTARDGARILMELIDEWGYAPSGRAYTIADRDEAFMFQLARGRHYMGARVPDDAIAVMPNHFNLHGLTDYPEQFYPADVVTYAIARGWYTPAKNGDFSEKKEDFSRKNNIKENKSKINKKEKDKEKETVPQGTYFPDAAVNNMFLAYLKTRNQLTPEQISLLKAKLLSLSEKPNEQLEIIQNAIIGAWKSFYPLSRQYSARSGKIKGQVQGICERNSEELKDTYKELESHIFKEWQSSTVN